VKQLADLEAMHPTYLTDSDSDVTSMQARIPRAFTNIKLRQTTSFKKSFHNNFHCINQ
jgi:hypothetical protein